MKYTFYKKSSQLALTAVLMLSTAVSMDPTEYAKSNSFKATKNQDSAQTHHNLGLEYYSGRFDRPQNYIMARKHFTSAAEKGSPESYYYLGFMHIYGQGVEKDYTKASEYFTLAAEMGNGAAQQYLGRLYCYGRGVPQDYDKALKYFTLAAEQGVARAQYYLGLMYVRGVGGAPDYKKASEYYILAAAQNHADAQKNLGILYYSGQGVPQDYQKALEHFTLAAEQKVQYAQFVLGFMHIYGQGVPQDYKKASDYYILAATQGHADAQLSLGKLYYTGQDGVQQDYLKALEYFILAADQGNAEAQVFLGVMYAEGQGVIKDCLKASKYYKLAADQGNAVAQLNLGVLYHFGMAGVEQDYQKALEYYTSAADQGNADAQVFLGVMYAEGQGVTQDFLKASEYYKLAADRDNAMAQKNLGFSYLNGSGVPQNFKKAFEYLMAAAKQGNMDAMLQVGEMCLIGNGTQQDYDTAFNYFKSLGENGHVEAKFYLSLMYEKGFGVDQNHEEALKYMRDYITSCGTIMEDNLETLLELAAPALWESRDHIDRSRIMASLTKKMSCNLEESSNHSAPAFVRRHVFTDGTGRKITDREKTLPEDILAQSNLNDDDSETIVYQVNKGTGKTLYAYNKKSKTAIPLDKGGYHFPKVEQNTPTHIYWSGIPKEFPETKMIFEFSKDTGISQPLNLPHPLCVLNKVSNDYAFLSAYVMGGIGGVRLYYCLFDKGIPKDPREWHWKLLTEELNPDNAAFVGFKFTSFDKNDFLFISTSNDKNQTVLNEIKIETHENGTKDLNLIPLYTHNGIGPLSIEVLQIESRTSFIINTLKDGKVIQTPLNTFREMYYQLLDGVKNSGKDSIFSDTNYLTIGAYEKESEGKLKCTVISDRSPKSSFTFTINNALSPDNGMESFEEAKTKESLLNSEEATSLPKFAKYFVDSHYHTIPSYQSDPSFGCLVWKPLFSNGTPPPAVLMPHGGPHVEETCAFDLQKQFLVNRGYVVISPIFSGSTNDGLTYVNGRGELSGRTQREMNRAVRYFANKGDIDAARVGLCGASFGGYVTLYQAAHFDKFSSIFPQGFKCALSLNGMSDLVYNLKTFQTRRMDWLAACNQIQCFEPLIEDPTQPLSDEAVLSLREKSPLSKAKDVKIPLMILQGEEDQKVPQYHADEFSKAMSEAKIDHTYGIFKGEGHNFKKSTNMEAYYAVMENFFAKYLGGSAEPYGDSIQKSTLDFVTGKELIGLGEGER